ncbi:MAG: hypothetical protein ACTIMA_09355 [Brachybacterium tyrofermentans]|uniref:hypothetical protein n=1 Tax=Brevibacterium sp. FME17 TaxID=2742606 RepID=UPI001866F6C0|nr:hypothetical protein [Brevibacterium sp. FME17]MDN5600622.1 hypothetical protein [Brachybacterium sp.]
MSRNEDRPIEASEALAEAARDLAYASRVFDDPADSYRVLGNLQVTLADLHQSIQQVAQMHNREWIRASSDTADQVVGHTAARQAETLLQEAAASIDTAYDQLREAFSHNGRIAWQPDPATVETTSQARTLSQSRPPPGR